MIKILNDYRFVVSGTEYSAPEIRRFHLQGIAEWQPAGSPRYVTTSAVVSVEGDKVTTRSGTVYTLGTPAEGLPTLEQLRALHPAVPFS